VHYSKTKCALSIGRQSKFPIAVCAPTTDRWPATLSCISTSVAKAGVEVDTQVVIDLQHLVERKRSSTASTAIQPGFRQIVVHILQKHFVIEDRVRGQANRT